MSPERNIGVVHGEWGENVAVAFLLRHGFTVLGRNIRPYVKDRRLELDVVALERRTNTLVFVEVKQHANHSPWERRLRSVDREKRKRIRRAANAWRRMKQWDGGYRFDVIEVYGTPESGFPPEVDHITNVRLFVNAERHVTWG